MDSTGGACDRKCSVFQIVHRAQPHGLKSRWNQTDVHPRFEDVRAFFVVVSAIGELGWKLSCRDSERGFVSGIALTENDETNVVRQQSVEQRDKNVETFFGNDPSDHSKNRTARLQLQPQTT